MKNHSPGTAQGTWAFLTETERQILQAFAGDQAEVSINQKIPETSWTEDRFFPFVPVGTRQDNQGNGRPWLPPAHRIITESTHQYTTIHHPQAPAYTKIEDRRGLVARVRRQYLVENQWQKALLTVWPKELQAMPWTIYDCGFGEAEKVDIYLKTSFPGVWKEDGSVYVPLLALSRRDWPAIAAHHERLACGYYRGTGFRVAPEQQREWEEQTRALLNSPEALALQAWCERKQT